MKILNFDINFIFFLFTLTLEINLYFCFVIITIDLIMTSYQVRANESLK